MKLLLTYLTIAFIFLAFLTHPNTHHNFFVAYYTSLLDFSRENIMLAVIGVGIAFLLLIRSVSFSAITTKPSRSLMQLMGALLVGSFLGLCGLTILAFTQLTILAITLDMNPQFAGVITDQKTILQTLKTSPTPPTIIATPDSKEREVVGIAQNTTGTDNVYGAHILPAIPNFFILPIERPLSSMILADNTLIITRINQDELQAVAPILGYAYVHHFFPDRAIKSNPRIAIMTEQDYLAHRIQTANDKSQELESEITLVNEKISSLSAGIDHDKDQVATLQQESQDTASKLSDQYRSCINAGEYQGNTYVHYYSESYCKTQQDNFKASQPSYDSDISKWNTLLSYDQSQLAAYKSYVDFFKAQKTIIQLGKANLPDELGVFEGPDSIQLLLETTNSHAIVDYIETLTHEYLHYASFISGKKLSSTFFEEGLTEYFARRAIQDSLNINTNIGYPVEVKIIAAMSKRIDESELADIYFSKDEDHLESALNRVYGDNFYEKNISLFQTLMYTADPQKELSLANDIMKAIGGQPFTENDLESTSSSL